MACPVPVAPDADYETKARHLRWLFRRHRARLVEHAPDKLATDQVQQAEQWRIVEAEYDRLFPDREIRIDYILVDVWTEARELAGWTYDYVAQCWLRADGSRVLYDDGSEWAHL